jgi:ABC-type branched-subunit amino acid transport system permease subunit
MSLTQTEPTAAKQVAVPRKSTLAGVGIGRMQLVGVAIAALLVFAAPLLPGWLLFLVTVALAKAMVVLGVVLLLRGDLVSFGHGLYYATGAYAVAFAMKTFGWREALLLVPVGIVATSILAAILGLFLARYRGIFFGMLTVAFSMILYSLLLKLYWFTGGTDGMRVTTATIAGIAPSADTVRHLQYYFVLVLGALAVYLSYRVTASPLGYLMRAIYDNEIRVEFMGASVRRAIYRTYVLSGALGGLGGALAAMSVGHVTPDLAYWSVSGEFVFVALFGGLGSVFAPVVGSVLFEFIRNYAFKLSPYTWQLTLGTVLLFVILFLPGGLWSLYENFVRRQHREPRPAQEKRWALSWKR